MDYKSLLLLSVFALFIVGIDGKNIDMDMDCYSVRQDAAASGAGPHVTIQGVGKDTCAGTLIGKTTVLTSAKCLSLVDPTKECKDVDVSGGSAVKASKCIPHEEHDIAIIQLDAEIPDTEPVSIAKEKPDGYCDVLGVAGEKVKVAACAGGGAEAGPGAGAGGDAGGGADAAAPGWRKKRTTKCSREGIELLCGTGTAKNCEAFPVGTGLVCGDQLGGVLSTPCADKGTELTFNDVSAHKDWIAKNGASMTSVVAASTFIAICFGITQLCQLVLQ